MFAHALWRFCLMFFASAGIGVIFGLISTMISLLLLLLLLLGGTGVSELTRDLASFPQGTSRSLQWSETGMEDPQEDPLAVHCFCVCSGSALLGDLLGVSRSRERDLPSVLSIYPRIFLCVFIVYRRIVRILCLLLYSAIC